MRPLIYSFNDHMLKPVESNPTRHGARREGEMKMKSKQINIKVTLVELRVW